MLSDLIRERGPEQARILVLPPTRRDGEAMAKLLEQAGIYHEVCHDLGAICSFLTVGAAAVILSEESLKSDLYRLADMMRLQPVWSDIPIIVLSRSGVETPVLQPALTSLGNVTVLERPVRVTTLFSIIRTALRARERQYQVRDHLKARQEGELERERLLHSERAARNEAERASQMKDDFLATLSHELRTPLSAILGWSQLLRMQADSPEILNEGIEIIERNARVQTQIIEDLLDMSRIISGKIRLDVQKIDLAAVVKAAIETVSTAADARGVRIETAFDVQGVQVHGDPNRLQQVFWNFLTNSVKFTPQGGRVRVSMQAVDSHLEVRIVDNGEGIDPEFLPHVFDRFRQADGSKTRVHGGLGLGLAIVRQLVELHGGTVEALSEGKGKGATFVVQLPLITTVAKAEPLKERPRAHLSSFEATARDATRLTGLKVLVVDDEPDARLLLERLLTEREAKVTTAKSAAEALHCLENSLPDIIISDVGMPEEDGHSFIRRVRALPEEQGGAIPAVALTAYARPEDRMASIVAGFQHHLPKPVEPAELLAILANMRLFGTASR